jgi:hypothetical protein
MELPQALEASDEAADIVIGGNEAPKKPGVISSHALRLPAL